MENKDFLFSIIVPVYNTEKYIEKSMDSIMKAIDNDCEVIFVNDGSTDKSKEKIMESLNEELCIRIGNAMLTFYKMLFIPYIEKGVLDNNDLLRNK